MSARWLAAAFLMTGGAGALGWAAAGAARTPAATGPDGGLPPTVKIIFQTVPPEKATILWGHKSLGMTRGPRKPLTIERPRDSGPLDVVVKSEGFLPVHTRAYTFTDSRVFVKLTPVEDKKTLFGYREEIPDGGLTDGGPATVGPPAPDAGAPDR